MRSASSAQLGAHGELVEVAFSGEHELVVAAQLVVAQEHLLDLGREDVHPRMISMSSLRPVILSMRRIAQPVPGSRRVRSRVR